MFWSHGHSQFIRKRRRVFPLTIFQVPTSAVASGCCPCKHSFHPWIRVVCPHSWSTPCLALCCDLRHSRKQGKQVPHDITFVIQFGAQTSKYTITAICDKGKTGPGMWCQGAPTQQPLPNLWDLAKTSMRKWHSSSHPENEASMFQSESNHHHHNSRGERVSQVLQGSWKRFGPLGSVVWSHQKDERAGVWCALESSWFPLTWELWMRLNLQTDFGQTCTSALLLGYCMQIRCSGMQRKTLVSLLEESEDNVGSRVMQWGKMSRVASSSASTKQSRVFHSILFTDVS